MVFFYPGKTTMHRGRRLDKKFNYKSIFSCPTESKYLHMLARDEDTIQRTRENSWKIEHPIVVDYFSELKKEPSLGVGQHLVVLL